MTEAKNIPLKKEEESKKFKLIISKDLEKKIRRLCDKYPSTEWSGQLFFFEREGSIADVSSLVIEAVDLFPADLGNASYTEYDHMERVRGGLYSHQEYMDDKDLIGATIGHVHSHHAMQSYFSQTDAKEINDHAKHYDYYLSLIVNNRLQCVAKICETISVINIRKTVGRNGVVEAVETKSEGLIQYDAIIEFEEPVKIDDVFFEKAIASLDEHIKSKELLKSSKPKFATLKSPNQTQKIYNGTSGNKLKNPNQLSYLHDSFLDEAANTCAEKEHKSALFSDDLTLAILSGWAHNHEFNYENPSVSWIGEIIEFIDRNAGAIAEFELTIRDYITTYKDEILGICEDYVIPAVNIREVMVQMGLSLEDELLPHSSSAFYSVEEVLVINKMIEILKK